LPKSFSAPDLVFDKRVVLLFVSAGKVNMLIEQSNKLRSYKALAAVVLAGVSLTF